MISSESQVTKEAAAFVFKLRLEDLPSEALRIAKRCILDGLGLILAGSNQKCAEIIRKHCLEIGQPKESTILGKRPVKVPAAFAALANGTAGHAMDWDDTQLSLTPDRIYGLLTHPTIPPLVAIIALAEKLGQVSGKNFLTAFLAGFEIECKIAEAIRPDHYKNGFHTSGTVGTFGSAVAAAKLIELTDTQLRHTIGLASSMGSGIRVNFGTMTKPLHVGRAAYNGLMAAMLARDGFEANMDALDGPWGFFQVLGGGFDAEKIVGCFGNPHSIIYPGVSIKPYPCGVLTHPSMDAMLAVVVENDIKPDEIQSAVLYAGSNILNPIRYPIANDELEAKFCMPFLLSAIAISRKAGVREFTPEFVRSPKVQTLMRNIRTEFDPEIEAKGWDKIRSKLEVNLKNGRKIVREADERYRGGPDHPLSDEELCGKFTDCTEALLEPEKREDIIKTIATLEQLDNIEKLLSMVKLSIWGCWKLRKRKRR